RLCYVREQAQHRQPDEEPVGGCARAQSKHRPERLSLRLWEPREPVEKWSAQLMEAGIRQLHLRLRPDCPEDREIRRRVDNVPQQRRLPHPGLTPQDQRPALAAADRRDHIIEYHALASPSKQVSAPPPSGKSTLHRWRPS